MFLVLSLRFNYYNRVARHVENASDLALCIDNLVLIVESPKFTSL